MGGGTMNRDTLLFRASLIWLSYLQNPIGRLISKSSGFPICSYGRDDAGPFRPLL
jgi:hypothetical protein